MSPLVVALLGKLAKQQVRSSMYLFIRTKWHGFHSVYIPIYPYEVARFSFCLYTYLSVRSGTVFILSIYLFIRTKWHGFHSVYIPIYPYEVARFSFCLYTYLSVRSGTVFILSIYIFTRTKWHVFSFCEVYTRCYNHEVR